MDFTSILKEQIEELEEIEKSEGGFIRREGLLEAQKYLEYPNILVITGIRRCGKSVYSYLLAKEIGITKGKERKNFGYVNFDDERLAEIKARDLNDVLKGLYTLYGPEELDFLVFDELQNVEKWELFVNRLRRTNKVIITGSNSNLLSSELSTHLTGRHTDFNLFPFSFREYLDMKKESNLKYEKVHTTKSKAKILRSLKEYLEIGGFPEVKKFGRGTTARIYEDIITKDILLRYKIRKSDEIKKLSRYLINNYSSEISYNKLGAILGVKHVSTISRWVGYLEDTFLIMKIERFSYKLKDQFVAPKKIYCIDNGLINAVGLKFFKDIGKLMENAVAIELGRRKSLRLLQQGEASSGVYYWKNHQQKEVDFLTTDKGIVSQLIQVTYASDRMEINEREIDSLIKASDDLKCNKRLVVITWDYEEEEKIKNKKIKFIPLWKWLIRDLRKSKQPPTKK